MGEMAGSLVGESPLVPNRVLLQIYQGMVESRMLAALRRTSRKDDLRGQEACRASALVDLLPEDFISDHAGFTATAHLRGASLDALLASPQKRSRKHNHDEAPLFDLPGLLPDVLPNPDDLADRLHLALGVALAIRRSTLPGVVILFATAGDAKFSLWRSTLRFAAQQSLPLFFVILPSPKPAKAPTPFELSVRATADGVPGIPVDASDAIALYRVAQESIGRARTGGGPALMECVPLMLAPGITDDVTPNIKVKPRPADPIAALGETLLRRKVCDEDWLRQVEPAFQAKLDAFSAL